MERYNKTGRLQKHEGTMKAIQSPKNAKNRRKEDRSGTLAKKKQVTMAKNGKHSKQGDNRGN